jgi:hypothetical protein
MNNAGFLSVFERDPAYIAGKSWELKRTIWRKARQFWFASIREYIQGCADVLSQHIATGMTMASLEPLARKLRIYSKVEGFGRGTPSRRRYARTRYFRTPELGRRLGESQGFVVEGSPTDMSFAFSFEVKIYQWLIHEAGVANDNSGIWGALRAGQNRMNLYINRNEPRLMKAISDSIMNWTITGDVTVNWDDDNG